MYILGSDLLQAQEQSNIVNNSARNTQLKVTKLLPKYTPSLSCHKRTQFHQACNYQVLQHIFAKTNDVKIATFAFSRSNYIP